MLLLSREYELGGSERGGILGPEKEEELKLRERGEGGGERRKEVSSWAHTVE